ncbi:NTP pyrophosphohydrolase [Streptomyces sp. TRM66268-LWL]|uniref:NTP pyrophosphohydrolase n=1 Tax=Streptomyces polyasparticus TaxID=2767826 RepID=A0ABR7SCA2_9ACTN|nr:NTP pyrophosphohydrolase [Streptomyces polyasparticus]MBC9713122.1 NTP pyrophosphohydrolase [Streptomyces polyasparticus]
MADTTRTRPMLIVDGANVVGSVPDGWWRDRRAAAGRLRDALAPLAAEGLPPGLPGPVDIVLVLEGAARGVEAVPGVRIDEAPGSGDDRIVELAAQTDVPCTVVTADRELRRRLAESGAQCVGPRSVYGGSGPRRGC